MHKTEKNLVAQRIPGFVCFLTGKSVGTVSSNVVMCTHKKAFSL
jgi:hypothetical protein